MKLFFTLTFKLLVKFAVLSEIMNEVIFHLDIQTFSEIHGAVGNNE